MTAVELARIEPTDRQKRIVRSWRNSRLLCFYDRWTRFQIESENDFSTKVEDVSPPTVDGSFELAEVQFTEIQPPHGDPIRAFHFRDKGDQFIYVHFDNVYYEAPK